MTFVLLYIYIYIFSEIVSTMLAKKLSEKKFLKPKKSIVVQILKLFGLTMICIFLPKLLVLMLFPIIMLYFQYYILNLYYWFHILTNIARFQKKVLELKCNYLFKYYRFILKYEYIFIILYILLFWFFFKPLVFISVVFRFLKTLTICVDPLDFDNLIFERFGSFSINLTSSGAEKLSLYKFSLLKVRSFSCDLLFEQDYYYIDNVYNSLMKEQL